MRLVQLSWSDDHVQDAYYQRGRDIENKAMTLTQLQAERDRLVARMDRMENIMSQQEREIQRLTRALTHNNSSINARDDDP